MNEEQDPAASEEAATGVDPARAFARVTGRTERGFVEFDCAIGEPDLFVDLIPGQPTFGDWAWRLADARSVRFR